MARAASTARLSSMRWPLCSARRGQGSSIIGSLKKPAILIPLGLFLAALLLRLVGIGWGLPNDLHNQTYHPDELVNFGVSQQLDIAHGNLTPRFYNYGTAYFIAENIADKVVDAYGGAPNAQDAKGLWHG